MDDLSDVEVQFALREAWALLRNAGIAAIVLGAAYGALGWYILLLLGVVSAAAAVVGLLTLVGVVGHARWPFVQCVLLMTAAFGVVEPGIWRWVFVGLGGLFGLGLFSRKWPSH